ncbi:MAG: hypothetical protein IMY67_11220 [Bacteroidetes bacterium]|nr:hypothetical protein [Bacteroidota bacterium]
MALKRTKEWLKAIKDKEVREKALENLTPDTADNLHYEFNEALLDAFNWSDTPEGHGYWNKIHVDNL